MAECKSAETSTSKITTLRAGRTYSSEELVSGLVRRDAQVSVAFFNQYNGLVNQLVRRLLGPDDAHGDIVNTAYVAIFSSIKTLREPRSLTQWVKMVVVNTVRDTIKRRRFRRALSFSTDSPEEFEKHRPVQACKDDMVRRIFRVLSTLKTDDRIIFVLHNIEGCTYEEIAGMIGTSRTTVKRRAQSSKRAVNEKIHRDLVLSSFVDESLKNV